MKAVDDAVAGMMTNCVSTTWRMHNHLLRGDNGAQRNTFPLYGKRNAREMGRFENVPLRGEKGSLWEGGVRCRCGSIGRATHGATNSTRGQHAGLHGHALKLRAESCRKSSMEWTHALADEENGATHRTKDLFWDWGEGLLCKVMAGRSTFGKRLALFNIQQIQ